MIKRFFFIFLSLPVLLSVSQAQVPLNIHLQILKAEDARSYDKTLEELFKHPHYDVRTRAALAAGRIGDAREIPSLVPLLEKGTAKEREMAAFALGEIESIAAADILLKSIENRERPGMNLSSIHARLLEAAGKIAAANAKDEKSKALAAAILNVLDAELKKDPAPSVDVIRFGLTAVLRAGGDEIVRKFLSYSDPNIVADALNTLARLKAKNANRDARDLLATHVHAIVRANAARVLGAAEDKEAVDILIKAAVEDEDSRVRVSAIRALANLKDARAADKLLERGEKLLVDYKKSKFTNPTEKNELLEIATTLGRILQNKNDERAVTFLESFAKTDGFRSGEIEIAYARIAPKKYSEYIVSRPSEVKRVSRALEATTQGMREFATLDSSAEHTELKKATVEQLRAALFHFQENDPFIKATSVPELLRTLAAFKPAKLEDDLRFHLSLPDVFIRATAAELLAEQPKSKENVEALKAAFNKALLTDKNYNDAQLATLDALHKLDKNESLGTLVAAALKAPDYLVRKKALDLLRSVDAKTGLSTTELADYAMAKGSHMLSPYDPKSGTKLGQILNTDADYKRAAERKNGSVEAVLTTEKGTFTIDLLPEDAPLTVDNFIKLAKANYFNGLEVHRVVPNFVMQDGDPRGDGNGGPGWSIRCEINMVPYERGAVGMALSGKDTGGSQWFVTHSPQPHLDGGYTVFGRVNDAGMKVVDNIARGDKILRVQIIESRPRRK